MRADRLLAILLILQSRGRATAGELAQELEVSERTIYRDMDALCSAGVPVYGTAGPEGGYALVDNYRTRLTGLTEGETRALFMLGGLAPLADLGVSEALRNALRKLSVSLPTAMMGEAEKVRRCFYFDSTWWQGHNPSVPHLQTVQEGIWTDHVLEITTKTPYGDQITRRVAPYGLVAKAGAWHLVCARENAALNVRRVSELLVVNLTDESFSRQADFDLPTFWEGWCANYERSLVDFIAQVRTSQNFLPILQRYFGRAIQQQLEHASGEEWVILDLPFESFEAARARILSFGRGVEVLAPEALRLSVLDYAEQIIGVYDEKEI